MTPNEAKIVRFMERRGKPITANQLANQFSQTLGYVDFLLRSLMRQMLLEKDKLHYRMSKTALDELSKYDAGCKYEAFEGKEEW